jgi:hypothetical protein
MALHMDAGSPHANSMLRSVHRQLKDGDGNSVQQMPVPEAPEVFPVPTSSRCVVILCVQYMIIYSALAACRTYRELKSAEAGKVEAGLRAAAQTLTYGPMLCVLFIACRMRVEFLSDGQGEPQIWVQICMYAITLAIMASMLLVLVIPICTGVPLTFKEGTSDIEMPNVDEDDKTMFFVLTTARYLTLLGLYGGLVGVIIGICTYMPPGHEDYLKLPAPAPAVMCTMVLAVVFFSTQLVIAACRSYTEFTGVELPKIVGLMQSAVTTVEFAPQLAILFLAARMRALQHDSQPESWVQNCMIFSTGAMCLTTLMSIAVPLTLGVEMKVDPHTKESTFEAPPNQIIGYMLLVVRYLSMVSFYGGTAGVAYSIYAFEGPAGPEGTLPVSPTVHCVVILTCQFFFVYMLMTIMLTVSEVTGGSVAMDKWKLFAAVESAKATLAFAPMLSILFVTTRMYALLITDKKGAPPAWVQDGMYMATWSLMISFMMCLITGLLMDGVEHDEDGNVTNKFSNSFATYAVTAVRYLSMILLYGGMVTVIIGLFVMTPETANGRGSVPVVSDGLDATPFGRPPPTPNDYGNVIIKAPSHHVSNM